MRYLVDANILSEPTKPGPVQAVVDWLRANQSELVVNSIVLGELRFGILLIPKSRRRQVLETWFEEGVQRIRCLPFDADAGLRWAELVASLRERGQSMPIKDSLIAATAIANDLVLVTRNQRDFAATGIPLINPFDPDQTTH